VKKKYIFFFLLLVAGYYVGFDFVNIGSLTGAVISDSYISDTGSLEAHFCPGNCENIFNNAIRSANISLDCALFELNFESTKDVIRKSTVEKRLVIDNNYKKKFQEEYVKYDTWGLQHNKFCIIDGKTVTTGSMNPTVNGITKNNNNLIIIHSQLVADQFQDEFDEMWNGTFKKGNPVKNPEISLDNTLLKVYFCPEDRCADRVKEELKKAEREIYFMTFSFTHEEIGNILLLKHTDGITVKGVMEARQVTKYSQFERLQFQGIDVVKDKNKQNMHHKVFIIDNRTVITGSFNPSNNGDKGNDENIVIIDDVGIAEKFLEEFNSIKSTQYPEEIH